MPCQFEDCERRLDSYSQCLKTSHLFGAYPKFLAYLQAIAEFFI
jgi:hypothetical protein